MSVMRFVAIPFSLRAHGQIEPGEPIVCSTADVAELAARQLALHPDSCGAVAFCQPRDPDTNEYGEPAVLLTIGGVLISEDLIEAAK